MGAFWDLWQESEIDHQRQVSDNLEDRVHDLEVTLTATITLLQSTIKELERLHNKDLDGDGQIG
ncbi:MAG: hypothetical protein CMG11_03095 [Candidatus Marinimicrobia bacterium]|nr:hypothetical protein [Candidatus Neomarinimicrobiota bacterium]